MGGVFDESMDQVESCLTIAILLIVIMAVISSIVLVIVVGYLLLALIVAAFGLLLQFIRWVFLKQRAYREAAADIDAP